MTDQQQYPTREQIADAERLAAQLESNADAHQESAGTERRRAAATIRALLSQPTPTGEAHTHDLGDPDEWHVTRCKVCGLPASAEFVREQCRYTTAALPPVMRTDHAYWPVIDPSTIRDVTPPPATPEVPRG